MTVIKRKSAATVNVGLWVHKGVLSENPSFIFQLFWVWDQYGLLVPVDSLEYNAVLMSLRAQKDSLTQIRVNRLSRDGSEDLKLNPVQTEIRSMKLKTLIIFKIP